MTKIINYEGQIEIEIPDNKIKEMLDSFNEYFGIDEKENYSDLFEHMAYSILVLNEKSDIEGVGHYYTIISNDQPDFEVED